MKIYQLLAQLVEARQNCLTSKNEWASKHASALEAIVEEVMPSGSGFDSGTKIDLEASTGEKLVFNTSFHHMGEHGSYGGWTEHRVIVRPSLAHHYHISVSGRDRNDIKSYIADTFTSPLDTESTEARVATCLSKAS